MTELNKREYTIPHDHISPDRRPKPTKQTKQDDIEPCLENSQCTPTLTPGSIPTLFDDPEFLSVCEDIWATRSANDPMMASTITNSSDTNTQSYSIPTPVVDSQEEMNSTQLADVFAPTRQMESKPKDKQKKKLAVEGKALTKPKKRQLINHIQQYPSFTDDVMNELREGYAFKAVEGHDKLSSRKALLDNLLTTKRSCFLTLFQQLKDDYVNAYTECDAGEIKYKSLRFQVKWMSYVKLYADESEHEPRFKLAQHLTLDSSFSRRFLITNIAWAVYKFCQCRALSFLQTLPTTNPVSDRDYVKDINAVYKLGGYTVKVLLDKYLSRYTQSRKERDLESLRLMFEMRMSKQEKTMVKERADAPKVLRYLDEGGLTFPKSWIHPYLEQANKELVSQLHWDNVKLHGKNFVKHVVTYVKQNEELATMFIDLVRAKAQVDLSNDSLREIHLEMLQKIAHVRIAEFMRWIESEKQNVSNTTGLQLRQELKMVKAMSKAVTDVTI